MDKYVSANKLKAKVISGEPVLFDEPTQHEIFFLLESEPSEDVEPVTHAHWIPQYPNKRTGKAHTVTHVRDVEEPYTTIGRYLLKNLAMRFARTVEQGWMRRQSNG